jgi:hypothetical protein
MTVVIGDPVDLSAYRKAPKTPAALAEATTLVMDAITDELAGIRGIPAPKERWNPSDHGQKETGRLDS